MDEFVKGFLSVWNPQYFGLLAGFIAPIATIMGIITLITKLKGKK